MKSFDEKSLREALKKLAAGNEEYAKFNARIVNTRKQVLGVRTPDLRKFAKNLARETGDFLAVQNFLKMIDAQICEEVAIAGFLINYVKNLSVDQRILLTREYLKMVDNWAQIDGFVQKFPACHSGLDPESRKKTMKILKQVQDDKSTQSVQDDNKKDYAKYWNFALENLQSDQEFFVRYGVMVLFENFLNAEKIAAVFANLRAIRCEKYYVKMGMAWLYAEAALDFFDLTLDEMNRAEIDVWTRRKALTKMLESRRFSDAQKQAIRIQRTKITCHPELSSCHSELAEESRNKCHPKLVSGSSLSKENQVDSRVKHENDEVGKFQDDKLKEKQR